MKEKMNFSEFKKCNVITRTTGKGKFVSLYRGTKKLGFSLTLVEEADLKPGDRVDLYRKGNIWAFKKCAVGCLNIVRQGTGNGLGIACHAAYYEIGPFVKANRLEAWVEDGIIYCMEEENEATGNEE